MTPLPKKKHAKSRSRTRRASLSVSLPHLIICPNCKAKKLSHHICPNCGYYKDQEPKKQEDVNRNL